MYGSLFLKKKNLKNIYLPKEGFLKNKSSLQKILVLFQNKSCIKIFKNLIKLL